MSANEQIQGQKSRWPTLEKSQQAVTFFRDFMIVLLFLCLLVFPAVINDRLVDAGFDEGSFAGLRWKGRVERSNGELTEAKTQIGALRRRLKVTQASLLAVQSRMPEVAVPNLAQIRLENARVEQTSGASLRSIQQTISTNERIVSRGTEALDDDARWVVIFGGDATAVAAANESNGRGGSAFQNPDPATAEQLPQRGHPAKPQAAMAVLPNARRVRPDAYACDSRARVPGCATATAMDSAPSFESKRRDAPVAKDGKRSSTRRRFDRWPTGSKDWRRRRSRACSG